MRICLYIIADLTETRKFNAFLDSLSDIKHRICGLRDIKLFGEKRQ